MKAPGCYTALGDSFSAGIAGQAPWPDLVAVQLWHASPRLRFHNLARAGVTSREVAAEQLPRALAHDPDLISLICGANDVLLSVRPDEHEFARTLEAMATRIERSAPRALVVTATYPAIAPDSLGPRTRRRVLDGLARFNERVRRFAARHDAVCLDWESHAAVGAQQNFAPDGFHPSSRGHRLAAAGFVHAIASARTPETASEVR